MTTTNLHPMINVAIKAARAAGAIINRAALDVESVRVSEKQVNDFVTEVDQASEQIIIETLLGAYPGHAIWASTQRMAVLPSHRSGRIPVISPESARAAAARTASGSNLGARSASIASSISS